MRHWNCKKLPDAWEKPILASGSVAWPSSSSTQSIFSDMNCFKVWETCLNRRFSLTAKHHNLCWHTSEPGLLFLPLTCTLMSPFSFGWLWMHVLLQDSPGALPPGNCPWSPRLGWVPFFRPSQTWTQLCHSIQVQCSCFLGTQSLHWCWMLCIQEACFLNPILASYHFPACVLPLSCIMPLPVFPLSLYHSPTCIPLSFYPPSLYPSQLPYPQYIPHQAIWLSNKPISPAHIPPSLHPFLSQWTLVCIFPHQTVYSHLIPPASIPLWKKKF